MLGPVSRFHLFALLPWVCTDGLMPSGHDIPFTPPPWARPMGRSGFLSHCLLRRQLCARSDALR